MSDRACFILSDPVSHFMQQPMPHSTPPLPQVYFNDEVKPFETSSNDIPQPVASKNNLEPVIIHDKNVESSSDFSSLLDDRHYSEDINPKMMSNDHMLAFESNIKNEDSLSNEGGNDVETFMNDSSNVDELSLEGGLSLDGGLLWKPSTSLKFEKDQPGGRKSRDNGDPYSLVCSFCQKVFANRGSMMRHKRDQHLEPHNTVICDICGKTCKNKNCLITHRSVTHGTKKAMQRVSDSFNIHPGENLDLAIFPPLM